MTGELRRKHENTMPADQSFGRLFAGVFFALAIYLGVVGKLGQATASGVLAGALLALSQFKADWLHLPNLIWYRLGKLLAMVVNPIVLGVIFFLLLTPLAMLLRVFGRDALRLKISGDADSYWIDRTDRLPAAESFKNQF
jgi:hypothetical protein